MRREEQLRLHVVTAQPDLAAGVLRRVRLPLLILAPFAVTKVRVVVPRLAPAVAVVVHGRRHIDALVFNRFRFAGAAHRALLLSITRWPDTAWQGRLRAMGLRASGCSGNAMQAKRSMMLSTMAGGMRDRHRRPGIAEQGGER